MTRRKMKPEDDELVRQLTIQGKTREDILEITGWSLRTIDRSRERTGTVNHAQRLGYPRYKYDREKAARLFERETPLAEIAKELDAPLDTVYRLHYEMGYAKEHPNKRLPPHAERLAEAARLVEEGASFAEIARTTHIHPRELRREFPGKQWTQREASQMAVAVRQANRKMRKSGLDIHAVGL